MTHLIKLLIFTCLALPSFAQYGNIPLNTWREHPNFFDLRKILKVNNTIFCAGESGLYRHDLNTKEVIILSRNDGLNDNGINVMKYESVTKSLVLGYLSGNIDIIKEGRIFNIGDIKSTTVLSGSRTINDMVFDRGFAYLACDFGIVAINLSKIELSETYTYLGPNGSGAEVYALAVHPTEDSIYAATSIGVIASSLRPNVNRYDFNNWRRFNISQGIPVQAIRHVVYFDNAIYAGQKPGNLFRKTVSGTWVNTGEFLSEQLISLGAQEGKLVFCYQDEIRLRTTSTDTVKSSKIPRPQSVILDGNTMYVGDQFSGLVIAKPADTTNLIVNGPLNGRPFKMIGYEDKMMFLSGGYGGVFTQQLGNNLGISLLQNSFWENLNEFFGTFKGRTASGQDSILQIYDPIRASYNDVSGTLYIGCFGLGIYAMSPDGYFRRYGMGAGILKSAHPPGPIEDIYIRITAMGLDPAENLWVFNFSSGPSGNPHYLHKIAFQNNGDFSPLGPSGSSSSYEFPPTVLASDLEVDFSGNVWMLLSNNTLMVFDPTINKSRILTNQPDVGGLPGASVKCIERDLIGNIWVGTENGIGVFYNPGQVVNTADALNQPVVNATIPVYDRRPLFRGQNINTIVTDGGNRKWVATSNGVFLINENGSDIVRNFTVSNSPLLDEEISDIAIIPKTGEVFFKSEKGVVSYRSDATLPDFKDPCKKIITFPNPVQPGYDGAVAFNDLPYNSNLKITDVSGRLHYETKSNGATAVWGLRDYKGGRAEPGVYIVFVSDEEGEKTCITKIAVVE